MKTIPLNKRIIVVKDHEANEEIYGSTIAIPDSVRENTNVYTVTDIGKKVSGLYPGDRIVAKKLSDKTDGGMYLGNGRFLVPASMAYLKLSFGKNDDGSYYRSYVPFGSRVLCRRLNREFKSKFGIIVPEMALEQTPFSEVIEVGPDVNGLSRGDVVLHEWSTSIIEIGLGGSADDYYVVVPIEAIRFQHDFNMEEIEAEFRQPSQFETKFRKLYEKKYKK